MRIYNALFFGLGAAGFVWVAMHLVAIPSPHLLAWPLLFVPTLPFFGMHFSNHAPLLVAYLVLGLGVLLMVLDANRAHVTGLLVGTGFGAAVSLSRSALPLLALIVCVLAGRVLLGDRGRRTPAAIGFWLGVSVPLAATGFLLDTTYVETQAKLAQGPLLSLIAGVIVLVARHPWLLVVAALGGAASEVALNAVAARVSGRLRTAAGWIVAGGAACAAVAVAAVMISSLRVGYPLLATLNRADLPSPRSYMVSALQAALTSPRLRFHDHLTSVSFWGGFGWIETLPPPWMIGVLTGTSGIALVVLLLRTARQGAVRRGVWLMFAAAGAVASVAAYAFTVISLTPADLHGRYLLGLYLAVLLVCWSPLAEVDLSASGRFRRVVVATGATFIAAIHAYCLCLILRRYF
jgi:hypothetical protein